MTTDDDNEITYSELTSMLSEGFHTAFRKAIDGPDAMPIHRLIGNMRPEDWSAVISFVADPLWKIVLRERLHRATMIMHDTGGGKERTR